MRLTSIASRKSLLVGIILMVLGIMVAVILWVFGRRAAQKPPSQNSVPPTVPSVVSSSTEQASSTDGTKTYTNSEFGFEFQYPEGWSFYASTFYSPFSKFNLVGASQKENGSPDPIDPSILVNVVTPDFVDRAVISRRNLSATTTDVIVAGVRGVKYEYVFEGTPQVDVDLPLGQYKMILGAKKQYENIFNQILASFRFLK